MPIAGSLSDRVAASTLPSTIVVSSVSVYSYSSGYGANRFWKAPLVERGIDDAYEMLSVCYQFIDILWSSSS